MELLAIVGYEGYSNRNKVEALGLTCIRTIKVYTTYVTEIYAA